MNIKEKIEKNGNLIIISFVALVIIVLIAMNIYSENSEPVIRVDMTLIENNSGQIEIKNIDLKQESTIYPSISEPNISEPDIPSIIGTVTLKGNPLGFGSTKYNGTGRYIFDIGFEGYHPKKNDEIRLSIVIINKNKDVIGYFVRDLMWR